jgi:ankyrin repeat protein
MPPLAEDTTFKYPCHIVSQYASEILPHFLKNGAYANIRAGDGSTPIHYAVFGYSLQAVKVLVEAGANINAKTNVERTAVHIVVSLQIGSILEYLLDNGWTFQLTLRLVSRCGSLVNLMLMTIAFINRSTKKLMLVPDAHRIACPRNATGS